ncbi:hypothetical protein B6R96_36010 (plasmid) [Streptomyces sp. Sge12]|uniref:hypothetical protein n=1 Tax=Streptomyces sp. Sge12 TaxID=1972846 RepID=UPI0009C23E23|nr:hypothetical protein [Streptomyces sp. Sge12]ARE79435.1 hypothetical protein B6R96_36010 [Streptomyces sp. Sge12]
MVGVPWDELAKNPNASEALITMLLLRLRPRAQEVDGTGGDGGRDLLEYSAANELINYEVKSFTGRMTPTRRRQVRRSLISSARHQPDHWDLVVPISPNPSELSWFDGLRQEFPFVRDWRGRNWLDQQFAAHPDLVRYALQESGDYILERIAEARAERDVLLRGIPDLVERYRALQNRAQEISPHYAMRTTMGTDGETVIQLLPKAPDAHDLAPIRFTGQVTFRRDDPAEQQRRQQFEDAIRFGGDFHLGSANLGAFTVDAPSELGVSGTHQLEALRITSATEVLNPAVPAQLAVLTPAGVPTASLPLELTERTRGTSGGTLTGKDLTGFLHVRMRFDRRNATGSLTVSFSSPEVSLPQAIVPALRFLSRARLGQTLQMTIHGSSDNPLTAPITRPLNPEGWDADEAEVWAEALSDLAVLQSMTGQFFPLPADFTQRDARLVKETIALLRGEKVDLNVKTVSVSVVSSDALDQVAAKDRFAFAAQFESMTLTIGEHQIDLGPATEVMTVEKILNLREARQELEATGRTSVRMRIDKTRPYQRYLGKQLPAVSPQL